LHRCDDAVCGSNDAVETKREGVVTADAVSITTSAAAAAAAACN